MDETDACVRRALLDKGLSNFAVFHVLYVNGLVVCVCTWMGMYISVYVCEWNVGIGVAGEWACPSARVCMGGESAHA